MAPSTFQKRKKYLESLGWIDILKVDLKKPPLIKPTIGIDDPNYEQMHWAKWHSSNPRELTLEELSKLPESDLKKYVINESEPRDIGDTSNRIGEDLREGIKELPADEW
jgi:hypothetical protein